MSQPTPAPLDSTRHQEMDEESRDILCPCSGTTRAQIRRHFDRGTADLDGISRATGACSGCGGCEYDVQAWLDELAAAKSHD
jgi:NAD(P)H-nitrite reductase large subunit